MSEPQRHQCMANLFAVVNECLTKAYTVCVAKWWDVGPIADDFYHLHVGLCLFIRVLRWKTTFTTRRPFCYISYFAIPLILFSTILLFCILRFSNTIAIQLSSCMEFIYYSCWCCLVGMVVVYNCSTMTSYPECGSTQEVQVIHTKSWFAEDGWQQRYSRTVQWHTAAAATVCIAPQVHMQAWATPTVTRTAVVVCAWILPFTSCLQATTKLLILSLAQSSKCANWP